MKKNVLILGMARSGTSLAASIFANQGYFVADTNSDKLQTADEYNPSGYWESSQLMGYNKEILAATGFEHDNTWFHESITSKQIDRIKNLNPTKDHVSFVQKFNKHSPWLWKDPRLCYTLEYWWPLLKHTNTRVLHVTRSSDEIYKSFLRVSKDWHTSISMDEETIKNRIKEHVDSAKKILLENNIPHVSFNYSDYTSKPDEITGKLNHFFNINLSSSDLGFKKKTNRDTYSISAWQRILGLIKHFIPTKK